MNTQTTHSLNALNGAFAQSASNFALSVVARQLSFLLQSKGYTETKVQSDVNGEPKSDERPQHDVSQAAANDLGGEFSFLSQERAAFNVDAACRGYACSMILAKDAVDTPMEYGRKPEANSIAKYFSTPSAWLSSKIEYWTGTISKREQAQGGMYSSDAAVIQKRIDGAVAERTASLTARTEFLARSIKTAAAEIRKLDHNDVVAELGQCLVALGFNFDEEVRNAAVNTLKIRKQRYEAGERVSAPQPGLLTFWSKVGVKGI